MTKLTTNHDKRTFGGVDVKRFQYVEYATNLSDITISLQNLIQMHLFNNKAIDTNCIMINLEKDTQRYDSTIEEFKKIGIEEFAHLKGTYWKHKNKMREDLVFVLDFLKRFHPEIEHTNITMDEFSVVSDSNIHMQDGPLACYISHLRAMIYGYTHFKDYTIICEDDICVTNAEYIAQYLKEIPDDWDIVMLNANSKNKIYDSIMYKFDDDFHSTHFYIIRNTVFPTIFKGMYPITDQVDVLVSQLRDTLNIYNIQETVYQKNIHTNTQNNLHSIFHSPNYAGVREHISRMENAFLNITNMILEDNAQRNTIISQNLMYDVFWEFVLEINTNKIIVKNDNIEDYPLDLNQYSDYPDFDNLLENMRFVLQCSKKGIKDETTALDLIRVLLFTLQKFSLHGDTKKAYGFGSTCHTYLCGDNIVKQYNPKLRWICKDHDNSKTIFTKELQILRHIQPYNLNLKLISYDEEQMTIITNYCGESLWDSFSLPTDWKDQIKYIFSELNTCGIYYPEFRLQNILVKNNQITFIDYGLSTLDGRDNTENVNKFIEYLDKLNDKLLDIESRHTRLQLITTFLSNSLDKTK